MKERSWEIKLFPKPVIAIRINLAGLNLGLVEYEAENYKTNVYASALLTMVQLFPFCNTLSVLIYPLRMQGPGSFKLVRHFGGIFRWINDSADIRPDLSSGMSGMICISDRASVLVKSSGACVSARLLPVCSAP